MAKVIVAPSAENDLEEIWDYLSEKNLDSSKSLIKELGQKFDLLSENPAIGRNHGEYIINLRSFPHKKYVIFYFPIENGVEIYRIFHGARNIEDLFEEFFEGLNP